MWAIVEGDAQQTKVKNTIQLYQHTFTFEDDDDDGADEGKIHTSIPDWLGKTAIQQKKTIYYWLDLFCLTAVIIRSRESRQIRKYVRFSNTDLESKLKSSASGGQSVLGHN